MKWQAFAEHGSAIFLCTFVCTHVCGPKPALSFSVTVALIHILIDWLKSFLTKRATNHVRIAGFGLDQLAHLYTLFLLSSYFTNTFTVELTPSVLALYTPFLPYVDLPSLLESHLNQVFVLGVVLTYVLFGGAVLNRMFLDCITNFRPENGPPHIGKWIGIIERAIILILVTYNQLEAIVYILTAKSIARFKQLDNRDFAEYYLVGTLASTIMAILGGLVLRAYL